jgi:hypothetical protein
LFLYLYLTKINILFSVLGTDNNVPEGCILAFSDSNGNGFGLFDTMKMSSWKISSTFDSNRGLSHGFVPFVSFFKNALYFIVYQHILGPDPVNEFDEFKNNIKTAIQNGSNHVFVFLSHCAIHTICRAQNVFLFCRQIERSNM